MDRAIDGAGAEAMNRHKLRREKLKSKSMETLAKDIEDYRDADCIYRNYCELPSCLGCRRLK